MKEKEIKILINNNEITIRELINTINDIYLICTDNCNYCKRNKLNDKDKINLIKKLIDVRIWKKEK